MIGVILQRRDLELGLQKPSQHWRIEETGRLLDEKRVGIALKLTALTLHSLIV
jgi:hypothetical protein